MGTSPPEKRLAVIIPSYNRPELLREALEATLQQSYAPAEIIVVDNASHRPVHEALADWLRGRKGVTVLRVDPNVNSAGAFYEGLKYAFRKGFDAYMFFDDDAEPATDCIRNLMAVLTEETGFVAPLAYDSVAGVYQFYHHKRMSRGLLFDLPVLTSADAAPSAPVRLDANATTGIIVSHRAIREVGNFNRHLRTYGEDTEFTYRIARRFPCYLVPAALLLHKVQPSDRRTQPLKNFYWVRNRFFIIRSYAQARHVPRYALHVIWRGAKDIVRGRNRDLKIHLYRLGGVGVGLWGRIPVETNEESLLEATPGVRVRVTGTR